MPKFLESSQFSLAIEEAILAVLINQPSYRGLIFYKLVEQHFFDPQHSKIFAKMQEIYNPNPNFDLPILCDRLEEANLINRINLLKITQYNLNNLDNYLNELHIKYLLRKSYSAAQNFCREIDEQKNSNIDIVSSLANDLLSLVYDQKININIESAIQEFKDIFAKRKTETTSLIGYSTGIKKLDILTNGIKSGELTIIGGQTSVGKSAFGVNTAVSNIVNKFPTLFLSLEMKKVDILQRIISIISEIPLTSIQLAKIGPQQETQINRILENLKNDNTFFLDDSLLNLQKIISLIRTCHIRNKIKSVIIDYIQFVPNTQSLDDYIKLTRSLSQLAKELDISIMAMSQLSRYIERREEDYRPRLSDLRQSGSIEEDAGTVILLHYPFRRNLRKEEESDLWAIVAKNRRGSTGEIKLKFDKSIQRITDGSISNKNIFAELSHEAILQPQGII